MLTASDTEAAGPPATRRCSRRAAIVIALAALGAGAVSGQASGPTLSGMRAHLFENKTAQLSEDILDPKYRGAWNTIAGPNAANATLVIVEVSDVGPAAGAGRGGVAKPAVHLVARETGRQPRTLVDRTQPIPGPNDQRKAFVPFLVYQGGCDPVRLTATLVGGRGNPLERTLAFACGE